MSGSAAVGSFPFVWVRGFGVWSHLHVKCSLHHWWPFRVDCRPFFIPLLVWIIAAYVYLKQYLPIWTYILSNTIKFYKIRTLCFAEEVSAIYHSRLYCWFQEQSSLWTRNGIVGLAPYKKLKLKVVGSAYGYGISIFYWWICMLLFQKTRRRCTCTW